MSDNNNRVPETVSPEGLRVRANTVRSTYCDESLARHLELAADALEEKNQVGVFDSLVAEGASAIAALQWHPSSPFKAILSGANRGGGWQLKRLSRTVIEVVLLHLSSNKEKVR